MAAAAVVVAGLAIPVSAYVVIPQFVRHRVVESAPAAVVHEAPTPGTAATPAPPETTRTLAAGDLRRVSAVDFGSGRVTLLQVGDRRFLRFENVEIAGAPAQHVYLSDRTDGQPGTFTDLGSLKATNGSFNYEVPPTVDLAAVRSVVSWCQQFKTTVTFAVLQPA